MIAGINQIKISTQVGSRNPKKHHQPVHLIASFMTTASLEMVGGFVVTLLALELSSQHCAHCARTIPQINVAKTCQNHGSLYLFGESWQTLFGPNASTTKTDEHIIHGS